MIDVDRADGVTLVTDHPSTWGSGRVVRPHYLAAAVPVSSRTAADAADAVHLAAEDAAAADLAAAVRSLADARRTVAILDAITDAITDAGQALADALAVSSSAADDAGTDADAVARALAALDTLGAPW